MVAAHARDLRLDGTCYRCGTQQHVIVNRDDWRSWREGKLIQVALPYLSTAEREFLISGLCDTCFQTITGESTDGGDKDD